MISLYHIRKDNTNETALDLNPTDNLKQSGSQNNTNHMQKKITKLEDKVKALTNALRKYQVYFHMCHWKLSVHRNKIVNIVVIHHCRMSNKTPKLDDFWIIRPSFVCQFGSATPGPKLYCLAKTNNNLTTPCFYNYIR